MIEAEFVGERKVAGMRGQSSAHSYWRVLRKYFGKKRIDTIKYADIESLKLYLVRKPTQHGNQRSVTDTNRHLQFLRAMLNYAVANGRLETNPFELAGGAGSKLIERSVESRGERFPTFGEELALIQACTREGARGNSADPTSPFYPDSVRATNELRLRGDTPCIVPQSLYEFWVVATRPLANRGLGLTPAQA